MFSPLPGKHSIIISILLGLRINSERDLCVLTQVAQEDSA